MANICIRRLVFLTRRRRASVESCMRLSELLVALVTNQPLSRDDRWQLPRKAVSGCQISNAIMPCDCGAANRCGQHMNPEISSLRAARVRGN